MITWYPIATLIVTTAGYLIGRKAGEALYRREDSRFFKRKHLVAAHDSYEKYGGKTIIIASTEGNIAVPEREEKIGLNVYRRK